MAKKDSYTYRNKTYKTLQCTNCSAEVHRVSYDVVAVTCWKCSMKQIKKYEGTNREGDTR